MVADLDLVNMFGNVKWPSTRKSPPASATSPRPAPGPTSNTIRTLSPSSPQAKGGTNRGAEQGDAFGTISSAPGTAQLYEESAKVLRRKQLTSSSEEVRDVSVVQIDLEQNDWWQ